ncbi:preprotein translocase subunit SecG [Caenimonas soli]|uniref:preprotein translocase subunit SecG n=1 Tax=Caenimonas soli TaxID=2735555 RepID=UPI001552717E|nr:preprotein translocase subunit SecG [Caenimonas soli]NPC56833.1 preprotein translocase subunit SecG [Caenimonas soli]
MNVFLTIILAVQMLTALGMIGLILIQHGKGADMGAAFGSGSSGSLFGASGSANFLSRTTAVLAGVFFVCTLALAYFGNLRPVESGSVLERATTAPAPAPAASGAAGQIPATAPAAPGGAAAVVPAPAASGAGQIPTK